MPASTPISRSKTAALSRVLNGVSHGYVRYISGVTRPDKAIALARKFHDLYGIGATPAQHLTRKRKGEANVLLVMYWPEDAQVVEWLLLVSPGAGAVTELEKLLDVTRKPRLMWLGFELVRYLARGVTRWTWRRPKEAMAEWYELLAEQLRRHQPQAVADTLARIARQPGFHGVREQGWSLFQYARQHGYEGDLPHLFYVQKVNHGDRLML